MSPPCGVLWNGIPRRQPSAAEPMPDARRACCPTLHGARTAPQSPRPCRSPSWQQDDRSGSQLHGFAGAWRSSSFFRASRTPVSGKSGNSRRTGPGSKLISVVSSTTAPRDCLASCGLSGRATSDIARSTGRGMWRTGARRPATSCTMAASCLNVRVSGPPMTISRFPRRSPVTTLSPRVCLRSRVGATR